MAAVRRGADLGWQLTANAVPKFFDDRGPQLGAAISFFALLSIFPLAMVLTAVYGLVASPEGSDAVIDFIVDRIPLSAEGAADLRSALASVTANAGTVGALGLLALVYSASALMGAARHSLNAILGLSEARAPLQGKLLDIGLVFGLGTLFAASLGIALLGGLASDVGNDLGIPRSLLEGSLSFVSELMPMLLAATVFAVALTVVPARRQRLRDIWPGIVVATAGYKLVQVGFAVYLENFSRYSTVYGSLGAVIAFMIFVYLIAMAFLLAGEYAQLWPRARRGELADDSPSPPWAERIRGWLRRLTVNPNRKRSG